jgi:hypothetical protein
MYTYGRTVKPEKVDPSGKIKVSMTIHSRNKPFIWESSSIFILSSSSSKFTSTAPVRKHHFHFIWRYWTACEWREEHRSSIGLSAFVQSFNELVDTKTREHGSVVKCQDLDDHTNGQLADHGRAFEEPGDLGRGSHENNT